MESPLIFFLYKKTFLASEISKNVGLFRLKSDFFLFFSLVLGENPRFPPASFLSFLMGLKALLFPSTPDFENPFSPAKPAAARFGTMKSLKN